MHDFQFYSRARIEELFTKENGLILAKRDVVNRLKVRCTMRGAPPLLLCLRTCLRLD